jgi:hypothetical protein
MTRNNTKNAAAAADMDAILAKLDALTEKLEALETLPGKMASLEKLLQDYSAKNASLQAEVKKKDATILEMRKQDKCTGAIQPQVERPRQQPPPP